MGSLFTTVARTLILDDGAYQEWQERPNLFLRGIVLIIIITLVAGLLVFAVNLVNRARPVDEASIREGMKQWTEMQNQWFPFYGDPEVQELMEGMLDVMVPMVTELAQVRSPLPKGITGFFQTLGEWLTRAFAAMAGWLFYGALVLIFVNLLGGTAKLPDFLGMVALYAVPGLLALFRPIPCIGGLLALVGAIWSIVVYIKATSVSTGLDGGRAIVAVVAPFLAVTLLAILLSMLAFLWLIIIF
jgi:hypothetical protein